MKKLIFKLFGNFKIFFLSALILLVACDANITGKAAWQVPTETADEPEVYFCPREDCGKIFESYIKSANSSAHCAFYDLDLKSIINSLAKKSKTADVRLVIDNANNKGQIKGEGVRMDDKNQLMHNKFCIIDSSIVLTGSFNPTDNDNNYNNNNVVVVYSRLLARNYEDEFEELWKGKFGKGANVKYPILYINNIKMQNYFCPEDDCASQIVNTIKNAKSSIKAAFFTFTSERIADELLKASARGVNVSILTETRQRNVMGSQYQRVKDFGLDIRLDSNKYNMHHKMLVIDSKIVVTGSFNPTLSADTRNDENLLMIHDEKIAGRFLEEFESLWQ